MILILNSTETLQGFLGGAGWGTVYGITACSLQTGLQPEGGAWESRGVKVWHGWHDWADSVQLEHREGPRGAGDGLREAGCVHTRRASYFFLPATGSHLRYLSS